MKKTFSFWKGAIDVDGTLYNSVSDIPSDLKLDMCSVILLKTNIEHSAGQEAKAATTRYRVSVKQYMLKQGTKDFDFMIKWNNDVPMPLRTMVGTIEKETNGMYYMNLQADTSFETLCTCMKCGKAITNKVSQFFGLGPECGGHNYTNPFNSKEELDAAVKSYKSNYLTNIKWSGWVIKSAITELVEISEVQNE